MIRRLAMQFMYTAIFVAGPLAAAAQSSPDSNCNVSFQKNTIIASTITIPQVTCIFPNRKRAELSVKYVVLDSLLSSLIVQNQVGPSLEKFFGENRYILQNDVFRAARQLVDRFGGLYDANAVEEGSRYEVLAPSERTEGRYRTISEELGKRAGGRASRRLKGVRVYNAEQEFFLPDIPAIQTIAQTPGWPQDYLARIAVPESLDLPAGTPSKSWLEGNLLACVTLTRKLRRSDLEDYKRKIDEIRQKILAGQLPTFVGVEAAQSSSRTAARKEIADNLEWNLSNNAIKAMLHVGSERWPDDFLLADFTLQSACGMDASWSFAVRVYPRQLFLIMAVIENVGDDLRLTSMAAANSRKTALRSYAEDTDHEEGNEALPLDYLRKGQSLIVPVSIVFRTHTDSPHYAELPLEGDAVDSPDPERKAFEQRLESALRANGGVLSLSASDPVAPAAAKEPMLLLKKPATSFLPGFGVAKPRVQRDYLYGRRVIIKGFDTESGRIEIRPFNPLRIAFHGGMEVGSCPVLYAEGGDSSEPVRLGSILVGAYGEQGMRQEVHAIPSGAIRLIIAEEETEIAHLDEIAVEVLDRSAPDPTWREHAGLRNVTLIQGGAIAVALPPPNQGPELRLRVRGYYTNFVREAQHHLTAGAGPK
jgi:hypothetical protein